MRLGASGSLVLALAVFAACCAAVPSNRSVSSQPVVAHHKAAPNPFRSPCRRYFGCTPIALQAPHWPTE